MTAWTFACLVCNETWCSPSSAHTCAAPLEYRRNFWVARLAWSPTLRDKTEAQIRALVCKPINRALLTQLLGASWDPAGDGAARMSTTKHRESAA